MVTHRVVEIDREKNEFTTWGIANDPSARDAPNTYENILGVVRLHLPVVGFVFSWLGTLFGKIICATVIIAFYLLTSILDIWAKGKKEQSDVLGTTGKNGLSQNHEQPASHVEPSATLNDGLGEILMLDNCFTTAAESALDDPSGFYWDHSVGTETEALLNVEYPVGSNPIEENELPAFLKDDELLRQLLENADDLPDEWFWSEERRRERFERVI